MRTERAAPRVHKQHSGVPKLIPLRSQPCKEVYAKHGELSRRLVWGLVHSERNTDVGRGLEFAEELLRDKSIDAQDQRDLVYLTAVAMYRLGRVRPCSLPDRHSSVQLNIQLDTLHHTSCVCAVSDSMQASARLIDAQG